MGIKNIGVIVGSTRRESYCMTVAKAVSALMPEGFNKAMWIQFLIPQAILRMTGRAHI
jgi:NAD(P)H-dependent FMN reductase